MPALKENSKIYILRIVIVAYLFCSPFALLAKEKYVILTEDFPPLSFKIDGEVTGIATEIVKEVFKQANLGASIEVYPWKRTYAYSLQKDNAFVFPLLRNKHREQLFHWIGPILLRTLSVYRLKERTDIVVNNIEDMKKYRTGVVDGESMHQLLLDKGLKKNEHLFPVTQGHQNIKKLFLGRIDLLMQNNINGAWILNKYGHTQDELVPLFIIKEGGYYIGANKDIPKTEVQQLQTALDKVKRAGLVEKIVSKYLK